MVRHFSKCSSGSYRKETLKTYLPTSVLVLRSMLTPGYAQESDVISIPAYIRVAISLGLLSVILPTQFQALWNSKPNTTLMQHLSNSKESSTGNTKLR